MTTGKPDFNKADGSGGKGTGVDMQAINLANQVASILGMSAEVVGDAEGIYINQFDSKITPPTMLGPTGTNIPKKMSISMAFSTISSQLPENELIAWKNEMYDAGLYPPSMYANNMRPRQIGLITDEDKPAFQTLFYTGMSAPGKITAQEIIQKMKKDNPYSKEKGYGQQKDKKLVTAEASDPATIRGYAKQISQALLGRDLDDASMNALVQKISKQEVGVLQKKAGAQQVTDDGVIISENLDVAARTQEEIEAANPAAVQAKKVTDGFDTFMAMMTGS